MHLSATDLPAALLPAPQLTEGKGEAAAGAVKLGVSLNFNRLEDVSSGSASSGFSWLLWLLGVNVATGRVPRINKADVRWVLAAVSGGLQVRHYCCRPSCC